MTPDKLEIRIRQRSNWEALDLGFALARHLWLKQLPVWLGFMAFFAIGFWWILPREWFADWGGLLIWWLKPLYDRLLLWMFSQQLFGQQPTLAGACSALPGLLSKTGLLSALTWQRFSPSRSYNLPVWQLEQLRGSARRQRQSLLAQQDYWQAVGLTIICMILELILFLSAYALIILMDPSGAAQDSVDNFFSAIFKPFAEDANSFDPETYWLLLLSYGISVLALFMIEPFYVAAGFALYLNRRNQLEAWDIEMAFRQIGQRLSQNDTGTAQTRQNPPASGAPKPTLSVLMLGGLLLMGLWHSPPLQAATEEYLNPEKQPASTIEQELETVMQRPEFEQRKQVMRWKKRDKEDDEEKNKPRVNENIIYWLADIIKAFLWVLVGVAIVFAIIYRKRLLAMLTPPKAQPEAKPPGSVLGLDVRPESLPDDIAGNAKSLWENGQHRDALSLLYRAALMLLTRRTALTILPSQTERDILQQAKQVLDKDKSRYLQKLTGSWQKIAYAHRPPPDQQALELFTQWEYFAQFDTSSAEQAAQESGASK